jgi:hypothetical protein
VIAWPTAFLESSPPDGITRTPAMSRFPHHRSLRRATAAAATVAFALFACAASATTLPVGAGGGACTYSTIQAAINAATSGDTITVADGGANYTEKLTITDKSLSISSCPCNHSVCVFDATHNTLTNVTISGAGGANAPVLKIVTTNANNPITVNLDRVTIQDGHSGSTDGGGISFSGVGTLSLTRTKLFSNAANYGAGINFKANGGIANLVIHHDTFITSNTAATSGGGLRIEGDGAKVTMNEPNTWVALNEATAGLGGGMEILNQAIVRIGSTGYGALPVIYDNTATNGGGIALSGGPHLSLFTSDAQHPVGIDNNTAYSIGGGIYVNGGWVCAQNPRLTNNIAQEGTAVFSEGTGRVIVNRDPTQYFAPGRQSYYDDDCSDEPAGVACDASAGCNVVHDNIAMNVKNGNTPTDGATLFSRSQSQLVATNVDLRGNHGGHVLRVAGDTGLPSEGILYNCLIADNTVSQELLFSSGGFTDLYVDNCTLTHNATGAASVIAANDTVYLNYDIIDSTLPALVQSNANLSETYNLAGNTSGLASTTDTQGAPTFVDAAHGDYRLFYGVQDGHIVRSAGIDYAPPITGDDRDGRGLPRDQSIAIPLFGDRDLGAYEMQGVGDRIFIDTFGDNVLLVH